MLLSFLLAKNKKRLVLLAFFYVIFLAACEGSARRVSIDIDGPTMGTFYHIKIVDVNGRANTEELKDILFSELASINQSMSTYIVDSELSLLNKAQTNVWLSVSSELCTVLTLAKKIHSESTIDMYNCT